MEYTWEQIVFFILLIDSVGAVLVAFLGKKWWMQCAGPLGKYFPAAKGWALYYLILVLFIGYLLGFITF